MIIMNGSPEFNNLISGITPLLEGIRTFKESDSDMDKKDANWIDSIAFSFAFFNVGYQILKTADNAQKFINSVAAPQPVQPQIDKNSLLLLYLQNPALALLFRQPQKLV